MAGPTNLRLLTDFFNKIGPQRHVAMKRLSVAFRCEADIARSAPSSTRSLATQSGHGTV